METVGASRWLARMNRYRLRRGRLTESPLQFLIICRNYFSVYSLVIFASNAFAGDSRFLVRLLCPPRERKSLPKNHFAQFSNLS